MAAADGAFDDPIEAVTTSIDVSGWLPGFHTLHLRARDAAGNWGPSTSIPIFVGDLIFADDFEAGSLAAWSRTAGTSGNPDVSEAAALRGTGRGMAVVLGRGDAYVVDERPDAETSYIARFWYDPNGWNPNGGSGQHRLFVGRGASGDTLFAVETRRVKSGKTFQNQIRLVVAKTAGTSATKWYVLGGSGGHAVEVSWQSGSQAAASLALDGRVLQTLARLNTSGRALETVELGVQGAPSSATGTVFFDEFVSTRTTPVGP